MGNDGDLQLSNNLIRQSGSYCYESWECWVCNPAPSRAMSCEFQSISWERWGIWINQAHHVKRIKKTINTNKLRGNRVGIRKSISNKHHLPSCSFCLVP